MALSTSPRPDPSSHQLGRTRLPLPTPESPPPFVISFKNACRNSPVWALVVNRYPEIGTIRIEQKAALVIRHFISQPLTNDLPPNKHGRSSHRKPITVLRRGITNLRAVLAQATGYVQSDDSNCKQCANGYGQWANCVTAVPFNGCDPLSKSCANCFYNGRGHSCSFRRKDKTPPSAEDDDASSGAVDVEAYHREKEQYKDLIVQQALRLEALQSFRDITLRMLQALREDDCQGDESKLRANLRKLHDELKVLSDKKETGRDDMGGLERLSIDFNPVGAGQPQHVGRV